MLDRLLNRTCDVYRYQQTKNSSGDVSNTRVKIASAVKMRITVNKKTSDGTYGNDFGMNIASTHEIFCKMIIVTTQIPIPSLTIIYLMPGDIIVDTSVLAGHINNEYKVDFVDTLPGGDPNSHWQIFATMVEPE